MYFGFLLASSRVGSALQYFITPYILCKVYDQSPTCVVTTESNVTVASDMGQVSDALQACATFQVTEP